MAGDLCGWRGLQEVCEIPAVSNYVTNSRPQGHLNFHNPVAVAVSQWSMMKLLCRSCGYA
jgi:hypothetical protein